MYRFGFIMEQALGHVTHHQNLARWVAEDSAVSPIWMPVPQTADDIWERTPAIKGNWSLKASLRARALLQATLKTTTPDALFWHTQTTALFAPPFMKKIPSVVSLDATPINYDTVGAAYDHVPSSNAWLEKQKHRWHSRTFATADALVTWCQWAADSLVSDYGVEASKITVIPPGVDLEKWKTPVRAEHSGRLRLLLVGGDFARKGGHELVQAFTQGLSRICELDIATRDEAAKQKYSGIEGLRIHIGLQANSDPLRELYARADVFAFPTLADCLPLAVMEAMAAGLPVITTSVGALGEEVESGRNGLLVKPGDAADIVKAVEALAQDAGLRRRMAVESELMAQDRFDARTNYGRILSVLKNTADQRRSS
jgi:glycosyltransferase involved in cell wall biosynthesis